MIVYNLYLKILNKRKISIIIYLIIFTILMFIMLNSNQNSTNSFNAVKINMAYVDNDKTTLTNNLKEYISNYAIIKDIKKENLNDAFFYHDIIMIVEIPKGFTDSFLDDNPKNIAIRTIPESTSSVTLQRAIEKYLNLTRIYLNNNLQTDNLHQSITTILNEEVLVDLKTTEKDNNNILYYYNYLAYILIAMLVTLIGSIMAVFRPIDIKRRNNLGTISNKKMNLILLLCNLLLGIVSLIIFIIISFILYPDIMTRTNGLLLIFNSLIFLFTIISLSYLLAVLFKSENIIIALATVISLGSSFLTGIFIPQFLLDDFILKIAKFIPSYWYVKANTTISTHLIFNQTTLKPIFTSYIMQIIFTIIFIVLALIISKYKQREEN